MIFLDSSFLIAYYNENDNHHKRAVSLFQHLSEGEYGLVGISDYVFNECATVLLRRFGSLRQTVRVCELIQQLDTFEVDRALFEATWEMFKSQDTELSFTDCSIIALMQAHGVTKVVTFDKEFDKVDGIEVVS